MFFIYAVLIVPTVQKAQFLSTSSKNTLSRGFSAFDSDIKCVLFTV